jgi:hypothetical protein
MKQAKTVFGFFSIVALISTLVVLLASPRSVAQSCSNFWIDPQTGTEQCLDQISVPSSSGSNASGSSSSSGGASASGLGESAGTVSSTEANQKYANQRFSSLSEEQLQPRMPFVSSRSGLTGSTSVAVEGIPGAVPDSDMAAAVAPAANGIAGVSFAGTQFTVQARSNPVIRSGKLYMAFGGTTYNFICSASLIGKSLLVTAAHCVHEYGQGANGWANKVKFVPIQYGSAEPFLSYESTQFLIPTPYYNGTDTCTTTGVVCNNDIALVALQNNSRGQQAGDRVGYFGYAWNDYGFEAADPFFAGVMGSEPLAAITQLGYPGSHDGGLKLQVNNSRGGLNKTGVENTWLGSAMTGGSSGGPWMLNLGVDAAGADYGSNTLRNVVIGTTSWGYIDSSIKLQGASSFGQNTEYPNASYGSRGAGNIGKLVYDACDNPALTNWQLQAKGRCR